MTTTNQRTRARRQQRRPVRQRAVWPWVLAVALVAAVVLVVAALAGRGGGGRDNLAGTPVDRFTHVHGLAIPAWQPDVVYLSTHEGLIRISPDGEWRYISEEPHDFMGFALHPSAAGAFYSSGHPAPGAGLANPLGFMVSTDRGRTWGVRSLDGEVDFHAMAVDHDRGEVVYGFDASGGRLLQSTDGGRTWRRRTLPHSQGVLALSVDASDADTVVSGTPAGVAISNDGGRSWEATLGGATVTAVSHDAGTARRIVAYVAAADRGLVESVDGGQSWRPLGLELGEDAISHLAIHPEDGNVIYAGSHGQALYRSGDGGSSWEQLAADGVPRKGAR